MIAECRGGVKYFHMYICVSEDLAAEYLGVSVIMKKYGHRRVHRLIIRLHRIAV